MKTISATLFLCLTVVNLAPCQDPVPAKTKVLGCDKTAIQWFKPGEFEIALARAKKNKRLLIIKGISFGVDDAGAKCATKGKW